MQASARWAKRVFDVVTAVLGLGLLGVLLPVVVICRLGSRESIFLRERKVGIQRRMQLDHGRGGRRLHDIRGHLFTSVRFRVLADEHRAPVGRLGDGPRLTRLGSVLRRTGLEQLPQMLNVLLGRMSLVGPRPASPEFVERLHRSCPAYRERLKDVKPGVFGLASYDRLEASGFYAGVCEKMIFDLHYATRLTSASAGSVLLTDLSIMVRCLGRALAERRPVGNDVIRLDYPRRFVHLGLDAAELSRGSPEGLGAEVTETEGTLTAWWYPPRRRGHDLPPPEDSIVASLCDEVRAGLDDEAVFVRKLRPTASRGCDIIQVQMAAGLNEGHRVCEHLVRVWEDLAGRSDDEDFAQNTTFLLASALTTTGGSVGQGRHRLITSIEVDHAELRLRVEIVPDESRPQRFEPLGLRMASVLKAARDLPVNT